MTIIKITIINNNIYYNIQNPLHLAILKRQINVIPLLIIKGVSLTFQDNLGNTPLHIACKYSLVDIVEIILATASNKSVSKCFEIRNYDGKQAVIFFIIFFLNLI